MQRGVEQPDAGQIAPLQIFDDQHQARPGAFSNHQIGERSPQLIAHEREVAPSGPQLDAGSWRGGQCRQLSEKVRHPLDMVGQWNRLYGSRGFLQYQFVVPFDAVDTMRTIVARIADEGHASFLAVLKRFGAQSGGLLSFPTPGWTLALDLPAGVAGLGRLLTELDELVLGVGGRHYLAKDAFATPDVVRRGYPRLDEWKAIRDAADPDGIWTSDQARRLDLI